MPTPHQGEHRDDFVKRCVPMVIAEGTAKTPEQAVAICNSMFEKDKSAGTELRCERCNRYLGKAFGTVVAELRCPKSDCKFLNQVKLIKTDHAGDLRFKFANPVVKTTKQ